MTEALPAREDLLANQQAVAELVHQAAATSPEKGWDAGQICAHLIINNGLFIRTAQAVATGGPAVYDNESSANDDAIAAFAAGAGSVGVLAEWLRQSATAYVDLLTTLPASVLDARVVTTIRHEGGRLVDGEPRRLGDLMVGQLTFHAGMHLEQLRDLVPAQA
jgi:hypothetical protein